MKRRLATAALALLFALQGASAQQRPQRAQPAPAPPAAAQPSPAQPAPAPEPPGPIYEARLLRLAEILGALTFLTGLCTQPQGANEGAGAAEEWRGRMRDLIEAEAQSKTLKERLAGAYNKGVIGYQGSYRTCTASGRLAMERLMAEGAAIAHDLAGRYGA